MIRASNISDYELDVRLDEMISALNKLDREPDKEIVHFNAEVTRACNLRCDYCFNESGMRMPDELGLNQWEQAISILQRQGARSALFTGGEVMARKDAPQIIDYALQQGLHTSILSNGFKIGAPYESMLKELERIQISLDSASPKTHDASRGEGSWRVARHAIDYARSIDVPVEISTTISEDRIDELEGLAGIAYLTGSKLLIRPMQSIGRAKDVKTQDVHGSIDDRKQRLEGLPGDIFVDDFAQYVPVRGMNHDEIVREEGYLTILPDGQIRGTRTNVFEFGRA